MDPAIAFISPLCCEDTGAVGARHSQYYTYAMKYDIYPLQFDPILKYRIWGGSKLETLLGKPASSESIGESWELSAVGDDVSIVSNGSYRGRSLQELIYDYPREILGNDNFSNYGSNFPLLFKFIDANQDLSIQVHPDDQLARKRHNSPGKTEMWYIMQADPNARITVGFKKKSSPEEYLKHLESKSLPKILNSIAVRAGEVFFLETGTVHAIGAGIVLAEIQQSSDVTYRIYDYDRVDNDGKPRELHVDLALDAINYDLVSAQKQYALHPNQKSELASCPFFTTNLIPLDGVYSWSQRKPEFTVLMCVEGTFELSANGNKFSYAKGDTVLIPALLDQFVLEGRASVLEIYI